MCTKETRQKDDLNICRHFSVTIGVCEIKENRVHQGVYITQVLNFLMITDFATRNLNVSYIKSVSTQNMSNYTTEAF